MTQPDTTGEVTRLLIAWRAGDARAPDSLFNLVYQELKGVAARRLARLGAHVLDPTELVNEALLRLLGHASDAQNRQHFFKVAAAAIRCTLVDIVRRQQADKRGAGAVEVTLSHAGQAPTAAGDQWLEAEAALAALEQFDPRKCRVAELAFLVGLNRNEIAEVLAVSPTTVKRDLQFARAWLQERLAP